MLAKGGMNGDTQFQPSQQAQMATLRQLQQRHLSNGSSLESIATAAVNLLSDGDDKAARLQKRRLQIAAASRKSRAKRKKELTVLKDENERLWTEVVSLKKRLRELGDNVNISLSSPKDKSHGAESQTPSAADISPNVVPTNGSRLISAISSCHKASTHEMSTKIKEEQPQDAVSKAKKVDNVWSQEASKLDPMWKEDETLVKMAGFFNDRLSWYFTQLKSDVLSRLLRTCLTAVSKKSQT